MKAIIFPLIIGLSIGLLLTAQFKAPRSRILNPVEPFSSLTESRDALSQKSDSLKDEIKSRRETVAGLQSKLKQTQRSNKELVEEFEKLKDEVGLTDIKDRGVVVTLADAAQGELSVDSIVHAADLRDVINVLWQAGAKAISINDERIVATTSVDSIVNTVLVNNTRITGPFVIKSTGNSNALADALNALENLTDLHRRQKNLGLIFNVEKAKEVNVAAFSGSFENKFAKVAP